MATISEFDVLRLVNASTGITCEKIQEALQRGKTATKKPINRILTKLALEGEIRREAGSPPVYYPITRSWIQKQPERKPVEEYKRPIIPPLSQQGVQFASLFDLCATQQEEIKELRSKVSSLFDLCMVQQGDIKDCFARLEALEAHCIQQ